MVSSVAVPILKAPNDLLPKTITVTLTLPSAREIAGGSVVIDPGSSLKEITSMNNRVRL
jgi:hypothetical protein